MKALLIEDEKAAVRNLQALLLEVAPDVEILAVLDSIIETIDWFGTHAMPDLVFLDIHLADGSAFEIFSHVEIACPIIFTTAYDEYALRAFKVNSIDYLLKPIDGHDIRKALDKMDCLHGESSSPGNEPDYSSLIRALKKEESYKTHFLVPAKGDKLIPVSADMILFFHIDDGVVKAVLADGKECLFPQTLDELADSLNPALFFRVNRQYLISRKAVLDIDLWFNGRLSVNLKVPVTEKILVSKAKVGEFKEWFTGG
ncbi:LytR/AlgR family response regulator transcription factor [Parabacteroides johnsonii]|jgi:two-component system LytT family response regulator|uniref:LytR/AlgR family response regulator transcription factor n=2 Tax=Parabacteroides johnsonii TaxID=387661 RepID=UPI001C8BC3E1|nr:LytTR family DNA-binding domain-containing protein [Parabacteroides johnsonii]MBX9108376.1 response regulator transcription factor [Parabacteroides johnsonii]